MPTVALPLALPAAPPPPSSPSPEQLIGEYTAVTAVLFAQGLGDCVRAGRVVPTRAEIKRQGAIAMAALIELREHTAGTLDFGHTAQVHGSRALQEWWGNNVSASTIAELIGAVLDILAGIIRLRSN